MKKMLISLLFVASIAAVAFAAYTTYTNLRVTNDLLVDNDVSVGGDLAVTGGTTLTGPGSFPYAVLTSTINVSVSTPTYVGQLALHSNFDLYVASGTANPTQWIKVGGQ